MNKIISKYLESLCDSHKKLYEVLCKVQNDSSKRVKSDKLESDEYIWYNKEKHQFEFEDGAYLGEEPMDIIYMFSTENWFKWTFNADWYVC